MTGFEDRCLNPVWRLGCLPGRGQAGKVAFLEGFEPPTSDFVEQRSIQLSYRNILVAACTGLEPATSGVTGRRSYPAELTNRIFVSKMTAFLPLNFRKRYKFYHLQRTKLELHTGLEPVFEGRRPSVLGH